MNKQEPDFSPAPINAVDFLPPLLRLQERPPNPIGKKILWALLIFLAALLLWALIGRLDIVAVAEGKLVPESYLKIVQPAESGIVKEILVQEGDSVKAGQVLMRMDALMTEADSKSINAEYERKRLTLRRIEAELADQPFVIETDDSQGLAQEVLAQHRANRMSLEAALAEERSRLIKAKQEVAAAGQVKRKLQETLHYYQEQDQAFQKLSKEGFASPLMASDKKRERLEKEQELQTQTYLIESAKASMLQSEKKLAQIDSDYRRQLHAERNEIQGLFDKLEQEVAKQAHKHELMELKASQDGVIKEMATHTVGTVVQPGTVLLTLIPKHEALRAEVWVSNEDIGFVRVGQAVKLKFAAFPFQKYGMLGGVVDHISVDAADNGTGSCNIDSKPKAQDEPLVYKALVKLNQPDLEMHGQKFPLSAGMQTNAEIWLRDRTVMEYLLSPVRQAWHEAGRER